MHGAHPIALKQIGRELGDENSYFFPAALMLLSLCSVAFGQVNCGTQPTDVPPDAVQKIVGEVEGKAQAFTKLLGDANLKGKVDASRSEIHQKFMNLDKIVLDRFMIWVSCQNIMQDKELKPSEKNRLWIEIYRELARPSDNRKDSRIPSDLLNRIRIGRVGSTSISYLESLIGVPTDTTERSAQFHLDGYRIDASFLNKTTVDGRKGKILRLSVKI